MDDATPREGEVVAYSIPTGSGLVRHGRGVLTRAGSPVCEVRSGSELLNVLTENIQPVRQYPDPDEPPAPEVPVLDPSNPFHAVVIRILQTQDAKRHDYTGQGASPWSNFDTVERRLVEERGLTPEQARGLSVFTLVATKDARLGALQSRPGGPRHESTFDSKLDKAVYCLIDLARELYPDGTVPGQ